MIFRSFFVSHSYIHSFMSCLFICSFTLRCLCQHDRSARHQFIIRLSVTASVSVSSPSSSSSSSDTLAHHGSIDHRHRPKTIEIVAERVEILMECGNKSSTLYFFFSFSFFVPLSFTIRIRCLRSRSIEAMMDPVKFAALHTKTH